MNTDDEIDAVRELLAEARAELDEERRRADGLSSKLGETESLLRSSSDAWAKKYDAMHRRCQLAEGAVLRKMDTEQAAGAPIAKRLAIAAYAAEQERRLAAESRLDWAREALECLLPGLTLDLRYADPDDDKDAMRSRIKTVTDALSHIVVERPFPIEGTNENWDNRTLGAEESYARVHEHIWQTRREGDLQYCKTCPEMRVAPKE